MDNAAIAIVIPVLDDSDALRVLARRIRGWKTQPTEVVVVSVKPEPELRSLCSEYEYIYIESVANRGLQLDQGARATRGEVLWFLHADAEPHNESLLTISNAITDGAEGGYFRFEFAGRPLWWKRLLQQLIQWRTRLGGIPYGDQGLFVHRDAYSEAGGFNHQPLFEEVALIKNLRARGHFLPLALPIGVAPRRWERDGWCRRSLMNRSLAVRYILGSPAEQLAARYDGTVVTDRNAN